MPKPLKGETQRAYISRYMSAPKGGDRPTKQKLAIAYSELKRRGRKSRSKR